MGEGMRTLTVLIWALCAVNSNSYAQSHNEVISEESTAGAPTIIYGAAKKADGKTDEVLLEQPQNAPNPLGDPITSSQAPEVFGNGETAATTSATKTEKNNGNGGLESQGVAVTEGQPAASGSAEEAVQLGRKFQNTLIEADGMVYDIQAYPTKDMEVIGNPADPQTIYSPNVNP